MTSPEPPRRPAGRDAAPAGRRDPDDAPDDAPVLPDRSDDDRDVGWNRDAGDAERDARWYEEQRPPHWE